MKTFILIIGFLLLNSSLNLAETCSKNNECLHSGKFNTQTGTCQCYPGYYGQHCEFVDCNYESSLCGSVMTPEQCYLAEVYDFCPRMCNNPICRCGFDTCLNNGYFNEQNCSCICQNRFSGRLCESPNNNNNLPSICETLCFSSSTTPSTPIIIQTTTSKFNYCQEIPCFNGGIFSNETCSCECYDNFYGKYCENLNCIADASHCKDISFEDCATIETNYVCPFLCGLCSTQTTVQTTGPTTVQATTACVPFTCQNGGQFLIDNCTCECFDNFNGPSCEYLNCVQDSINCNDPSIDASYCQSIDGFQYICPFLCGLCGSTSAAPQTTVQETSAVYRACDLVCQNAGVLNRQACTCTCPDGYLQPDCAQVDCNAAIQEPAECSILELSPCQDPDLAPLCVKTCACLPTKK